MSGLSTRRREAHVAPSPRPSSPAVVESELLHGVPSRPGGYGSTSLIASSGLLPPYATAMSPG